MARIFGIRVAPLADFRLEVYAALAVCAAGTLAYWLLAAGYDRGNVLIVLALAAIAAFAERGTIRLRPDLEESISLLPTLFAAVLFGPLPAMVVGAASMLGDAAAAHPRAHLRWAIYSSTRALSGAAAGFAAMIPVALLSHPVAEIVVATLVGVLVIESADILFAVITGLVRGHAAVPAAFRTHLPVAIACIPLYAPLVALLAIVYREVSALALPLFLIPAVAAQRLYTLYEEQRQLGEELSGANQRLEAANMSFATALVTTLDARDEYTAGHSLAVAVYARDIAQRLGLDDDEQRLAYLCGLVHDVGKIGLPPGLLEKPSALTLEERRLMERHSEIGERILLKVESYDDIARIVRHHHERVDGLGYPDRLAGDEIPMLSRIVAVADAYDAMTSDRPYRDAMPSRVARLRLAQAVETQFDTTVVAAFEAILAGATEDYRSGASFVAPNAFDDGSPAETLVA